MLRKSCIFDKLEANGNISFFVLKVLPAVIEKKKRRKKKIEGKTLPPAKSVWPALLQHSLVMVLWNRTCSTSKVPVLEATARREVAGLLSVCLTWSHGTFTIKDHLSFLNNFPWLLCFYKLHFHIFFSHLSPYSLSFYLVPSPQIKVKYWSSSGMASKCFSFSSVDCP